MFLLQSTPYQAEIAGGLSPGDSVRVRGLLKSADGWVWTRAVQKINELNIIEVKSNSETWWVLVLKIIF